MAIRGVSSNARASSAVEMAMSASSSALGSAFTVQSANNFRLSLKATMYVPDARRPSCVRTISSDGRMASGYVRVNPVTSPSTRPSFNIIAAKVLRWRTR